MVGIKVVPIFFPITKNVAMNILVNMLVGLLLALKNVSKLVKTSEVFCHFVIVHIIMNYIKKCQKSEEHRH